MHVEFEVFTTAQMTDFITRGVLQLSGWDDWAGVRLDQQSHGEFDWVAAKILPETTT